MNLPPFYIGQKVVCIKTKSSFDFFGNPCHLIKKGDVFTVQGISKCCKWVIDIGKRDNRMCACEHCGHYFGKGIVWANAKFFAPREEGTLPLITFKEINKIEKEEILTLN